METSRGIWTSTTDVDLLLRLASGGFDWLALDAQHGPVDRAALHVIGRALAGAPTPFLVRVPAVDAAWIGAALDAGAAGVIVPSVEGVADAGRAALATRYPPLGDRSWGPFAPLWGGTTTTPEEANQAVQCWVMVETSGALDDVDVIAATPGVDGLFVGPFDLSLSLGTTPEALLADHDPTGPLARVVAAAERQGILVGGFAGAPERARALVSHGIPFVAVTSDAGVVEAGVRAVLGDLDA
ncbi:HpcH/HpaI aldolase family protein [Phycicoccus duodecadis]|uniref:4-hydroxy-2-oxoheptanedioate aldolase n=1 Tax=Phycicoccus duodecadis TaxID=173053 RepID=A0A2N3YIS2_9MICO|nr:aldolase/citrate lyase family protein [Phycicoccus duodecadis]PKW26754.1 4-hydroxy-2-oxoheptanedioate aldolase [Phycicoccus duodecadis]